MTKGKRNHVSGKLVRFYGILQREKLITPISVLSCSYCEYTALVLPNGMHVIVCLCSTRVAQWHARMHVIFECMSSCAASSCAYLALVLPNGMHVILCHVIVCLYMVPSTCCIAIYYVSVGVRLGHLLPGQRCTHNRPKLLPHPQTTPADI